MKRLLFAFILMFGLMLNSNAADKAASTNQEVTHVVMIWLNADITEKQAEDIIDKAAILSTIDVVKNMKVGKPVASEKKAVDDSFTFAIYMGFNNEKDLRTYMVDEIHHEYVKSVLKPALKNAIIYDFK